MTKEIYHQGWLIKSPPPNRVFRPRWHRRWFTLKQGELPEQFCLDYYTDSDCRTLKGVIDLDQCERVDSGLRLEKFQHIFFVQTPRRTYYLAAASDDDMNYWVKCICQVCNLRDFSPQNGANDNRQYYNIGAEAIVNQPIPVAPPIASSSANTQIRPAGNQANQSNANKRSSASVEPFNDNNNSVYQNFDVAYRNSTYNNRETMICDASLTKSTPLSPMAVGSKGSTENYYNFVAIANDSQQFERSQSMRTAPNNETIAIEPNASPMPNHGRTQSLVDRKASSTMTRKIPQNLNLNETFAVDADPSPSLSTSSGPYIAISECISGNPLIDRDNPMTPLNSLDPKFYEMPRSHIINIGLNLTNDQPYSPKRNNCPTTQPVRVSRSGRSSPTDSESVFTDDEEWSQSGASGVDRKLRPSESSIENDAVVSTNAHRTYFKLPNDGHEVVETGTIKKHVHSRRSQHVAGLSLDEDNNDERNKEVNSSDTENASPAITFGPKDNTSCVEENYDIPRSHQLPYYNLSNNSTTTGDQDSVLTPFLGELSTPTSLAGSTSTLNSATLQRNRHFYTNAAPTQVEGNVFRYDFDEQPDAPAVDRKLKPKGHPDEKEIKEEKTATVKPPKKPSRPTSTISIASSIASNATNTNSVDLRPPCVDRKLKPITPNKFETTSLHRRNGPSNLSFAAASTDNEFRTDLNADKFSKTLPRSYMKTSLSPTASSTPGLITSHAPLPTTSSASTNGRQNSKLEYLDLDHSNPPEICKNGATSASVADLPSYLPHSNKVTLTASSRSSGLDAAQSTYGNTSVIASGIVYKSVDFIKTQAIMRTRQDAELNRAKNRQKE